MAAREKIELTEKERQGKHARHYAVNLLKNVHLNENINMFHTSVCCPKSSQSGGCPGGSTATDETLLSTTAVFFFCFFFFTKCDVIFCSCTERTDKYRTYPKL